MKKENECVYNLPLHRPSPCTLGLSRPRLLRYALAAARCRQLGVLGVRTQGRPPQCAVRWGGAAQIPRPVWRFASPPSYLSVHPSLCTHHSLCPPKCEETVRSWAPFGRAHVNELRRSCCVPGERQPWPAVKGNLHKAIASSQGHVSVGKSNAGGLPA